MEFPEPKSAFVLVAGGVIIAAAIFSALPEPPPDVSISQASAGASTTRTTPARSTPARSQSTPARSQSTPARSESKPTAPRPENDTRIQVDLPIGPAKRFEAVPIRGTQRGASKSLLQVQRREGRSWVSFPLPTVTDQSGAFRTQVELDRPGPYWLRVVDPRSGARSEAFRLLITD